MNPEIQTLLTLLEQSGEKTPLLDELMEKVSMMCHKSSFLQTIFEESPDAIFIESLDGIVLVANEAAAALHGMTTETIVGKSIYDLTKEEDHQEMRQRQESIKIGAIQTIETHTRTSAGAVIPIEIKMQRIEFNAEPAILLIVRVLNDRVAQSLFLKDLNRRLEAQVLQRTEELQQLNESLKREIAEKEHIQIALENQKNFLQLVIDDNPSCIVVRDMQGISHLVNKAYLEFINAGKEEVLGKNYLALLHNEEEANYYLELDQKLLQSEQELVVPELAFVHRKTGQQRVLSTIRKLIRPFQDHAPLILVVGTDITDIKTTQDELRRSNEELERFAYIASHDLQSPLRTIVSYLQLIAQRQGDKLDAETKEFLNYSIKGGRKMQQIILDLLNYSRMGVARGGPEKVNLQELVDELMKGPLENRITSSKAIIQVAKLPVISGYRISLLQLFQNLLDNAMKFVGAKRPEIFISIDETGSHWIIGIKDNGIGIDPTFSETIFEIFQRLHTEQEFPGTGVGLAICKKAVDQHAGAIWFNSIPGEGTTFYFSLSKVLMGR